MFRTRSSRSPVRRAVSARNSPAASQRPGPASSPATSTTAPKRSTWCENVGPEAVGAKLDVTDPGSARAMVEAGSRAFWRVDALINNAALYGALARRPLRRDRRGGVGRGDGGQRQGHLELLQGGGARRCAAGRRRQHRQHRLARRDLRHAVRAALHDLEGGGDRADAAASRANSAATASGSTRWRRARSSPRAPASFRGEARPRARHDQGRPDDPAQSACHRISSAR